MSTYMSVSCQQCLRLLKHTLIKLCGFWMGQHATIVIQCLPSSCNMVQQTLAYYSTQYAQSRLYVQSTRIIDFDVKSTLLAKGYSQQLKKIANQYAVILLIQCCGCCCEYAQEQQGRQQTPCTSLLYGLVDDDATGFTQIQVSQSFDSNSRVLELIQANR